MKQFNLTHYSVTHPVGIFMIVLFFVVLGLYSYWRIGVELYPNINTPYVVISVNYDGADAESVEQQITKPVEDALHHLPLHHGPLPGDSRAEFRR